MSLKTDVHVLVEILDPNIPKPQARNLILAHLQPQYIRVLRRQLESLEEDDLEFARKRGPEWLVTPEGQDYLNEHAA